jgi:hypothetical protein
MRMRDSIQERVHRGELYLGKDFLFDTISIAAGAAMPNKSQFFLVPIGTNGKTQAQTNMQNSGQLANNDIVWIRAMRISLSNNTNQIDAVNINQLTHFSIKFKNVEFTFGPLDQFPGGSQMYVTSAANLGTAIAVANLGPVTSVVNGVPSIHNVFEFGGDGYLLWKNDTLEVDQYLDTSFTLLTAANGGTGTTIRVSFDVVRAREVA